jgi:hypothetical protein
MQGVSGCQTAVPTVPDLIERFADGCVTVYENPNEFSRAFVVGRVTVEPNAASVLDALSSASRSDLGAAAGNAPARG